MTSRARVRPRVLSPETGESLPLTDVAGPILTGRDSGAIRLLGRHGSGKTTALNHLAGLVPPHLNVSFLDEPSPHAIANALSRGWVVFTSRLTSFPTVPVSSLKLAPWAQDEWIEYLLASDHRQCTSVMDRLTRVKEETTLLGGIPELWVIVLDRMIADPSLPGPRGALQSEFAALVPDAGRRILFESDCFDALATARGIESLKRHHPGDDLHRLIRHRPVQLLLATDWVANAINQQHAHRVLCVTLPRDLVREVASRIADDAETVDRLRSLFDEGDRSIQPMLASLLHALDIDWKPGPLPLQLEGAYLNGAFWPEIDLTGAPMQGADLSNANLSSSRLGSAILEGASLSGAYLCGSSIERASFARADLSRASLEQVRAERACFASAILVAANLERGNFDKANFEAADLTRAQLSGASLNGADLRSAKLDDANFAGADLSGANMQRLTLVRSNLAGARFASADLSGCNLEGINLPGANFADANLRGALLTGSRMPGANFSAASLRASRPGWRSTGKNADLRRVDLREAAFHLGSSRSGLVGSPIACEGSRTGFYTDDSNEQAFKSPEEIRKANLRGADLRGAIIIGVDFYLVDLRGARLDPKQLPHIRRSGAILEARA